MNPTTTALPRNLRPMTGIGRSAPQPRAPAEVTAARRAVAAAEGLSQPAAPSPVSWSAAAAQPAAPPASDGSLTASLVANIPMHAPSQPAAPITEDDELDSIMTDIGHELKQAERKTPKKRFSLFQRKPKPQPRPVAAPKIMDVAAQPAPPAMAAAPAAQPPAAAVAPKSQPKPPKTSPAPLGAIFAALLVTSFLIAAAIYSYK